MKKLIDYDEPDILKYISVLQVPTSESGVEKFHNVILWIRYLENKGFDIRKKSEDQDYNSINFEK